MDQQKDKQTGPAPGLEDIACLAHKLGISAAEVEMALAEIHYAAGELEDFLKVKYRR